MKKASQRLFAALLLITVLGSCKKDEHRVVFNQGTAPVLSASITGATIPLDFINAANDAIKLSWTNPQYQFNTGISSYDVSYQLEIDTTGANFTNPDKKVINISKDLNITLIQSDLNDYLLNQLKLAPKVSHNIEIRIKSFLLNTTGVLYSNVLKFAATPYSIPPKIAPPTTGKLFLVGDATAGLWANPVPLPTQEFTKKDELHFEITKIHLNGAKEYLFLPLNGDWGHKYACKKKADQSPNGGDFGLDLGDNFPGPVADGDYKIEVDFQRGKYTVTKL